MALAWNQPSSIYIQPGSLTQILLTYTVSQDAIPDSIGIFQINAYSQNDTSRSDTLDVTVTASMVSDASVSIQDSYLNMPWSVNPGELVSIGFEITNNASVQDIFSTNLDIMGISDWNVVSIVPEQIYLNSNSSGTFVVTLQSPESAQFGDNCPGIIAEISSLRSGQTYQSQTYDNLAINQINDVSIQLTNSPESLIPGIVNTFNLQIENLGNGAVTSNIILANIPSSWNWWLEDEFGQILMNIQLSERSELDYVQYVQLKIEVPAGVEPNRQFSISISASVIGNSEDTNSDNNEIIANIFTSTVRNIILSTQDSPIYIGVGNSTKLESYIFNLGNVDEGEVQIRAQITSQDYSAPIESYFTIGTIGITFELDIFHTITLAKNSSRILGMDIVLPQDIPIDSTISILFEIKYVDSGIITKSQTVDLIVNHVRKISTEYGYPSNTLVDDYGQLWINNTIESTADETLTINFENPENWNLLCQSKLVNDSGITIQSPFSVSIIRTSSIYCEVLNDGMVLEDEISISVIDTNGNTLSQNSIPYSFPEKTTESTSISLPVIGGIGMLVVILIAGLMFTMNRFRHREDDYIDNKPISGPPISGPPISNQNITHITPQDSITETSPPIPENGLPQGWTMEQWKYYGQQYLEMTNRQ